MLLFSGSASAFLVSCKTKLLWTATHFDVDIVSILCGLFVFETISGLIKPPHKMMSELVCARALARERILRPGPVLTIFTNTSNSVWIGRSSNNARTSPCISHIAWHFCNWYRCWDFFQSVHRVCMCIVRAIQCMDGGLAKMVFNKVISVNLKFQRIKSEADYCVCTFAGTSIKKFKMTIS